MLTNLLFSSLSNLRFASLQFRTDHWYTATGWKRQEQFKQYADSNWSISIALRFARNKFKSPSHALAAPLSRVFYYPVASHIISGIKVTYCSTKLQFSSQASPWQNHSYSPLGACCGFYHTNSLCITQLGNHLIDVHFLQHLSLHFRPHRVRQVPSCVIHREVVVKSAKVGHHMLLERTDRWQPRWMHQRSSAPLILLPFSASE